MTNAAHQTVLLNEAVSALIHDPSGIYIDATFGRGGHSDAMVEKLNSHGQLLAIDKDPQAIAHARDHFGKEPRFNIVQASFADLSTLVDSRRWQGRVAGVLLDLGVSSPQLDQAERGFSFLHDGPLDMRMNPAVGMSAADWVNRSAESDMVRVFKEYGEERFARRIVRAIIAARTQAPITRTKVLAEIVAAANPAWEKGKHPATRVFQAIRIQVNDELVDLQKVLQQALEVLAVGGRLVVISFHSLEDRIVKRFIRRQEKGEALPAGLPIRDEQLNKRMRSIGKPVRADDEEVSLNPRSRSAIMRVAEKIK